MRRRGVVGITWAWREQGLILPPDPLGLAAVADLARAGMRVVGRQSQAGSQVRLTHRLTEASIRLDQVGFLPDPALAEDELAAAVAENRTAPMPGFAAVPRLRRAASISCRWCGSASIW